MSKSVAKRAKPTTQFTLGRKGFAKISAVEGVHLSAGMEDQFREFDRKGLSAVERRKAISRSFGKRG